jgi:hypothetical protein
MGVIKRGILGGVSGKIGTVIGGTWKGIDYLRARPNSVANPNSEKQQNQRSKFSTVLNFLKPLTKFLSVGFRNYATGMTAFNVAMSYNVKNAVIGDFPDFSIDYQAALLSKGNLTGALNPTVSIANLKGTVANSTDIEFDWTDNSGIGSAKATDLAMLVAYFENEGEAVYQMTSIPRSDLSAILSIPSLYLNSTAQCWIAFQAADSKEISNSQYVGSIELVQPAS